MPSGRFAANGAWLAVQVMAHNLARWTARIGLGERTVITKTLRRGSSLWWDGITRSARRLTLHLPRRWPWEPSSVAPWPGCKPFRSRPDGQPATDSTSPQSRATPVARVPCCVSSRHPAHRNSRIGLRGPVRRLKTVRRPPIYPTPGHLPCSSLTTPFRCPHAVHRCPSVDSG